MKINNILNLFDNLTLLELNELIKSFEERYNVSNSLNFKNENNESLNKKYSLLLNSIGSNKISIIKFIKDLNNLGLKESKDLIESVPVLIKSNLDLSVAEDIKKKLEELGCSVDLK